MPASVRTVAFNMRTPTHLPYESNSIDAVVVSRLFLIVPDKEGIVREIYRVLKPGGRCFIAEPTSDSGRGCRWR